jgi:hypothetical protein
LALATAAVTALLALPPAAASAFTLSVRLSGSGTGSVVGGGFPLPACSTTPGHETAQPCSGPVVGGFVGFGVVTLEAIPDGSSTFNGWSGNAPNGTCNSGTENPCRVVPLFISSSSFAERKEEAIVEANFTSATPPAPVAKTEGLQDAASHYANLAGLVNPKGNRVAACTVEYGTTTAYGESAPCSPGTKSLGSGNADVPVSAQTGPLEASTTYHYRFTALNSGGVSHGEDMVFTTAAVSLEECPNAAVRAKQGLGAQLLPDCMAYEQVSPAKKFDSFARSPIISDDGNRIRFSSGGALGDAQRLGGAGSPYVTSRGASGWGETKQISPPAEYERTKESIEIFPTPDLSHWAFQVATPEQLKDGVSQVFEEGVDGSRTPLSPLLIREGAGEGSRLEGAAADLSHVFFSNKGVNLESGDPAIAGTGSLSSAYEAYRDAGGEPRLRLLARDLNGTVWGQRCGARIGAALSLEQGAISADGRTAFFSTHPNQPPSAACATTLSASGSATAGSNQLTGVTSAKGTGTTTEGSEEVTAVAATTGGFLAGQTISIAGATLTPGTTIEAVSGNTLTLSSPVTAGAGAAQVITAGPQPFSVGQQLSVTGLSASGIASTTSGSSTLSAATTTTGKGKLTGPATGTGNTASGTASVTSFATTTGAFVAGQKIAGVGIGSAEGTGTLASGSKEVTALNAITGAFAVGETITGAGIPIGTTVSAVGAGTLTLSAVATASGTALPLNAYSTVKSVSGTTLTLSANATATGTGVALSASSKIVTSLSTTTGAFTADQGISAAGIPSGTKVEAVAATSLELSAPATASETSTSLSAGPQPFAVGQAIIGAGIPSGAKVTAIDPVADTITISAPAEAGATGVTITGKPTITAISGNTLTLSANASATNASLAFTTPNPVRILRHKDTPAGPQITSPIASECNRVSPPCDSTDGDDEFQAASLESSKVFFTTTRQLANTDLDTGTECKLQENVGPSPGCDLYLYDYSRPAGERLTQVSAGDLSDPERGRNAEVIGVTAISGDGSHAYFVARGVLTTVPNSVGKSAQQGKPNLYMWERDAAHPGGRIAFVGTLQASCSGEADCRSWNGSLKDKALAVPLLGPDPTDTAVGGDGHILAFQTNAALIGEDQDGEMRDIYRYDTETGQLKLITASSPGALGGSSPFQVATSTATLHDTGEAGDLFAQLNRWISEDGETLVFRTREALLPGDIDGESDTYLWKAGQLALLAPQPSDFQAKIAVSQSGNEVAFSTAVSLVGGDGDEAEDVYVARVDGGFPVAPKASGCAGEACQGAATPPPGNPGAGSASFRGPGNLKAQPQKQAKKKQHKHKRHRKKNERAGRHNKLGGSK